MNKIVREVLAMLVVGVVSVVSLMAIGRQPGNFVSAKQPTDTPGPTVTLQPTRTPNFQPVTLCHASPTGEGNSGPAKSYELITVDNEGQLNGHLGHPNDIIPAPSGGCPTFATKTEEPTATGIPSTATGVPPTATDEPTATEVSPTETEVVEPTETQEIVPTETEVIEPTATEHDEECRHNCEPTGTPGKPPKHKHEPPERTPTGVPHGVDSGLNFQPGACAPWAGAVEAKEIGSGNTLMLWEVKAGDCWSGPRHFWTSFKESMYEVYFTPTGGAPIKLRVKNNWTAWGLLNVLELEFPD